MLATAITRTARGDRLVSTKPLRHYFMVTGSRFSITLERLRDALADRRFDVVENACATLRLELENIVVDRFPVETRTLLAETLATLEESASRELSLLARVAALLGAAAARIRAMAAAIIPEYPIVTAPLVVFRGAAPSETAQPLLAALDLTLDPAFSAVAGVTPDGSVHVFEDHVEIVFGRPHDAPTRPAPLVVAGSQPLMEPALFSYTINEARAKLLLPEGTFVLEVLRLEFFTCNDITPPLLPT
jgi:hypothetical protein